MSIETCDACGQSSSRKHRKMSLLALKHLMVTDTLFEHGPNDEIMAHVCSLCWDNWEIKGQRERAAADAKMNAETARTIAKFVADSKAAT